LALEENKAIARRFVESFSTGDLSRAEEFIAPNCHLHGPGTPANSGKGPDRYRETVLTYRKAFPDIRLTIDDEIAESDKVVVS
jgi:predicted ester cyclase